MSGFPSLEARVFASYLETLPDFAPRADGPATRDEQARFYAFVKSVFARAAEKPELLIAKTHPDDAHPNRFNKSAYGKPELATDIRKAASAMDGFFDFLARSGEAGRAEPDALTLPEDFKVPKKQREALAAFGITLEGSRLSSARWPGMFRAWKMLASHAEDALAQRRRVSRMEKCAFVENAPGAKGAFTRLLGEEAASIAGWLEAHGYLREHLVVNKEITTLRYTKDGFGAQFCYDVQAQSPAYLQLLPRDWRAVLPRFAEMRPSLQEYIARSNRKCDGCGFCTQRTPGAQRFAVTVAHGDGELALCPLFPNYSYTFDSIDASTASGTIECLRFLESALDPQKAQRRPDDARQYRV